MFQRVSVSLFAVALGATLVSSLPAAKYNRVVEVGDKAMSFTGLAGIDGKTYSLTDFGNAKAVAVVFTCNNCPVAISYQDRLVKLAEEYKDRGLAVVAINVNKGEDLEAMRQRSEEAGFNFPYVQDESQEVAKKFGATCTPHAFLLDGQRAIAYMGAIDDNWGSADEAKEHYLRAAIDAVLSGESPAVSESKQVGCGIKWAN